MRTAGVDSRDSVRVFHPHASNCAVQRGRQPGIRKSNVEASPLYPTGTQRIHDLTPEERAIYATLKPERLPEHVAIIMDGNGRWAGNRSLKRFLGHQQGAKSV